MKKMFVFASLVLAACGGAAKEEGAMAADTAAMAAPAPAPAMAADSGAMMAPKADSVVAGDTAKKM